MAQIEELLFSDVAYSATVYIIGIQAGSKKKEKICFALLTDYLRSFSNIPSNSVDAYMHAKIEHSNTSHINLAEKISLF